MIFTANQIGEICTRREPDTSVALQIERSVLWEFNDWRDRLKEHLNAIIVLDTAPTFEEGNANHIAVLNLLEFIDEWHIFSISAKRIIRLAIQMNTLGPLHDWLNIAVDSEQQFEGPQIIRFLKKYNLTIPWDESTPPAQTAATPTTAPSPVVAASDSPAKRNRKPSWATVALPYMKLVFGQGKYKSATVFYRAMLSRADMQDSPFTKLNGQLYCPKAGTTVSVGSMGTKWREIRAL
jgi:hypothetical protein